MSLPTIDPTFAAYPGPHAAEVAAHGAPHRTPRAGAARPPSGSPPPSLPTSTVYGYWPYWVDEVTDEELAGLTHVAVFNVSLNSDGTVSSTSTWTSMAPDIIDRAHALGVKVHVCITSFDDSDMESALGSSTRRATTISQLTTLVDTYGADGVNVDYEGLPESARDDFVTFITDLNGAVDELYIAMPAIDWAGSYDYDQLAIHSDGLFIMGYEYHWSGGDPGPNAPIYASDLWGSYGLDWSVDDYLTWGATADKIVLGLPLYGHWWPTTSNDIPGDATDSADSVTMVNCIDYMSTYGRYWDDSGDTAYTFYGGGQLWCDDLDAVQQRVAYAIDSGLQGVGFWALGYDQGVSGFWEMMADETGVVEESDTDTDVDADTDTDTDADTDVDTDTDVDADDTAAPDGPVARAGSPFLAYPGDTVILDGTGSSDPEGDPLRYRWQQVEGELVTLNDGDSANPSFIAEAPGTLTFELIVTDGLTYSEADQVDVIVVDPGAGSKSGCATAPGGRGWLALALAALASAWRRRTC